MTMLEPQQQQPGFFFCKLRATVPADCSWRQASAWETDQEAASKGQRMSQNGEILARESY